MREIESMHGSKDELISYILRAPELIQGELTNGSENPWSACFSSIVAGIRGRLELGKSDKLISEEEFNRMWNRVEEIKKEARRIRIDHNWNPPEELRQQLIESLKTIVE